MDLKRGLLTEPPEVDWEDGFRNRVTIDDIRKRDAHEIYRKHHEYLPYAIDASPVRHGIFLDDFVVGAISYSNPFGSHYEVADIPVSEAMVISRICITLDLHNLASCALSKSQDIFERDYAESESIKLLITYIKEGYEGTMLKALTDKGWTKDPDHETQTHQPSNKEQRDIWEESKSRWYCKLGWWQDDS